MAGRRLRRGTDSKLIVAFVVSCQKNKTSYEFNKTVVGGGDFVEVATNIEVYCSVVLVHQQRSFVKRSHTDSKLIVAFVVSSQRTNDQRVQ